MRYVKSVSTVSADTTLILHGNLKNLNLFTIKLQTKFTTLKCECSIYGRKKNMSHPIFFFFELPLQFLDFSRTNHCAGSMICRQTNSVNRVKLLPCRTFHVTCNAIRTRYVCLARRGSLVVTIFISATKRGF